MSIYPNFPKHDESHISSHKYWPTRTNYLPSNVFQTRPIFHRLHTNLTSPYPRSANSFRLKSKIARKSRSTFRLIDLGVRRSRVLGSDQSGLVAVPQGQTSIAGEPGTVQAPLRPEPATPSRGQAQGRWCAGQHRPQCSFRRGQWHAPSGQHIWWPVELSVPVPRDTFAFWIGWSDGQRAHRGRTRVSRGGE